MSRDVEQLLRSAAGELPELRRTDVLFERGRKRLVRRRTAYGALSVAVLAGVVMAAGTFGRSGESEGPKPAMGPGEVFAEGQILFTGSGVPGIKDSALFTLDPESVRPKMIFDETPVGGEQGPDWNSDHSSVVLAMNVTPGTVPGKVDANLEIHTIETATGEATRLTTFDGLDNEPVFSPDGNRIVFTRQVSPTSTNLFIMERDGSNLRRLTNGSSWEAEPAWSPDGDEIAFSSALVRDGEVYGNEIRVVDPSDGQQRILAIPAADYVSRPAWSPDSERVVLVARQSSIEDFLEGSVYVVQADGSGEPEEVYSGSISGEVAWSPDATEIAFARGESTGANENRFSYSIRILELSTGDTRDMAESFEQITGLAWD